MSDNNKVDNWGHTPGPVVFWSRPDGLQIVRHCEGIFALERNGVEIMPPGSFEHINRYLWLEFDVMGTDTE